MKKDVLRNMKSMEYKDEFDWHDLKRKPEKLFGFSYVYFFIVLSTTGLLYVWNMNFIGKNSIKPFILTDSSIFIQDIPFQSPRVLPPINVRKVGVTSTELVSKGKTLYQQNCSTCHGDDGQGNGPVAGTLTPKPRNFLVLTGWLNGSKVSQMYTTLETGIPGSAMSSFNYMPPAGRFAIIHYVRSLATEQPLDSQAELQQLDDRFNLSKGVNIAGQIPIKKAIQIVARETKEKSDSIQKVLDQYYLKTGNNTLLAVVVVNPTKLCTGFFNKSATLATLDLFMQTVLGEPEQLGFKPSIARLNNDQWLELYKEVKNIIGVSS